MPNIQNICEQLTLARRPAPGDVLTVDATGNDAEFVPPAAPPATALPFPFAAPTVPNGNNDEFVGALAGWTVAVDVGAPNTKDVNMNGNSRVLAHIANAANDALLLTKPLVGVWAGDISQTVSYSLGRTKGTFTAIDFGFLAAGLNSGFVVRVATPGGTLDLLNFSNWTANTSVGLFSAATAFDIGFSQPGYGFAHLQRVGGVWSVWLSQDCSGWILLGTDATALAVVGSALGIRGFGSTAGYTAGVDFVRYNWLFLP